MLPKRPLGAPMFPRNNASSASPNAVVLDLFLDFTCPYSKKLYETMSKEVIPNLPYSGDDPSAVERTWVVNFHCVPQPWHPQSALLHEAALCMMALGGPEAFHRYAAVLFAQQDEFSDEKVGTMTFNEVRSRLAQIAPKEYQSQMVQSLAPSPGDAAKTPGTIQALKYAVRFHRMRGVHVTPTVHVNGIPDASVSSSWTKENWVNFLKPLL